ncbi:spermidine synthase [Haloplanus aerogenes]|uniref:Spermidine synthase n=1 Tax=Haloplanus aerogenes TaxID=660522 RepID=A0A3M0CZN2_9EURY|nr:fused MFS/spermidine synthase [Haloplanus aerogenes]AZH26716.1 spermidine synthase [Haloplanus aerogenes]RMB12959.1 putative membrane-bound spermidine synthase [Haloplanus aerogenes]
MASLPRDAWRPSPPGLAVFVSGVASMGLEILAGRIVAPQFGSSIYTWGSIIAVFLAALSLGYHLGGKRAAGRASDDRLAWLLLGTAAYVALVVFASDILMATAGAIPLPSRFASLPAVILLFGPPTYLLGFISPYAAELTETEGVGAASGHVYAVGTVGSIVGAFVTTFVLIPELSVEAIGVGFGLLLVGTALWLTWRNDRHEPTLASIAVALLVVGAGFSGALGVSAGGPVLYQTQTPYQELEVTQVGDVRTLYLDGQPHSAMDVSDPDRHVFEYTRYFHLPMLMTEDVDRVLFVGGGGFTGPKHFASEYNVTVDVAELDPEVIRTAKRYFRLEESDRLNVYNTGGRQFLQKTNHTYDLIVLDAYKKDKVPFQLTTVEFMRLAESRLDEDGVLFANLISAPSGPASKFYRAEYKTIAQAFPQVYTFPTASGSVVQNVEVVATKRSERLSPRELLRRNDRREIGIDLTAAIEMSRPPPPTDDVPILRDDQAPVDALLDPMVGQRYVVQRTNVTDPETPARAVRLPARSRLVEAGR